jgi:hypothetical protein
MNAHESIAIEAVAEDVSSRFRNTRDRGHPVEVGHITWAWMVEEWVVLPEIEWMVRRDQQELWMGGR